MGRPEGRAPRDRRARRQLTLAIEPTTAETYRYGAGSDFESDAEEYTAWYLHTDEDGEPIDHEFDDYRPGGTA